MKRPLSFLKNQLVNAILMVALTVPLILVAVSLDSGKPTLSFEGARIQVAQDGSVQLLFDVCISNVELTDGTQFTLSYNEKYLVPSDYDTNEALIDAEEWWASVASDKAFRAAPGLYYADPDGDGIFTDVDPFKSSLLLDKVKEVDHAVNGVFSTISMYLFVDRTLEVDEAHNSLMRTVNAGERNSVTGTVAAVEKINVLDASKKLVIGTLSFRVLDPDLMPTITEKFDGVGMDNSGKVVGVLLEDNHAKDGSGEQLIHFTRRATGMGATPWGIGYIASGNPDVYHDIANDFQNDRDAQATFAYRFPRTIIKARAAEAELTINAYQAYTSGHVSDIDQALQRYSPAITVTYSDGSEGNFIMPWGRDTDDVDGLNWTATVAYDLNDPTMPVVVDGAPFAGEIAYDPTASHYRDKNENQRYLVQKDFCYEEEDFNGVNQRKTFPLPIDVRLTVTPIVLVDVTANDLHRSYILNDALVDGLKAVQSAGALKLPNQARLITDVPAGGVTLTMDIPGWSHPQDYTVDGSTVTRYWPSQQLDATSTVVGTGTTMDNLWKDVATEATSVYLHWPVPADIQSEDKWMAGEANGQYLGANRAGVYTFKMAESYGGNPMDFTRPVIQAIYPWLTIPDNDAVPGDPEAWPIEDATRTIVWNDDPAKDPDPGPDPKPRKDQLVDPDLYLVSYISTKVDDDNHQPEVTLRVSKTDNSGVAASILPDSVFRIRLPDGTELGIGDVDDVALEDWFADNDGSYEKQSTIWSDYGDRIAFDLTSNPGDPTENRYGTEREKLRRYINLGGWFSVAVKEIDNTTGEKTLWSDFMPVYVPPRDNYYTEDKEYNFIGDNAGLYPWPGGVSTTVILPPGTYNRVDALGVPVYVNSQGDLVSAGSDGAIRATGRYDLTTTYDGATGAQPGRLATFTVDPVPAPDPNDDWQKTPSVVAGKNITTYGPEFFLDSAVYNAYGKVLNQMSDRAFLPVNYLANAHTATIRVENDQLADPQPRERVILEFVATHGGEKSIDYDDTNGYDAEYRERYNVSNVIFETRTQGYTMRQDYVLRLRNVGDVDISGISIDTLTDLVGNSVYDKSKDSDPAGGHFEILKAPASFLPAGESTTFVLTYVYNLEADGSTPVDYRDKLFITSNSHHTVPTGDTVDEPGVDYLLDFDAQFQVTNSDIHRVTVRVVPTDSDGNPLMGTAGVIMGETRDGSGSTTMNIAAGPTAFARGNRVYIIVTPYDEYTRHSVVAVDSTGASISIDPYTGAATIPDGHQVYVFTMPDYDTTVTVTFQEPISSKLRLSDLRVYADREHDTTQTPEDLYPHNPNWNTGDDTTEPKHKSFYQRRIWQKSFTAAEQATAATYTQDDGEKLYLMTKGRANKPDFDSQVDQYLVVLPADADWAQVEVDLRAVEYIFSGDPIVNQPLEGIIVQMTLYHTDDVSAMIAQTAATTSDIYPTTWSSGAYATTGSTNGPTTHTSIPFLSPDPGKSKYVRVQLSYTENGETTSRAYYIELHRAPAEVDATLNYGNSPYGMIMNDGAITNKTRAKTTFVNNNYTFAGMADGLVPGVVRGNGLQTLHYWLETWAPPTETWTDPNANWTTYGDVYDADTGMSKALYDHVHDPAVNLDLNDYAFFAIMGETFLDPGIARATDSSGRPVDLSTAVLSLTAYTLDNTASVDKTEAAHQLIRFALPDAGDPDALAARTVTFEFLNIADGSQAVSGDQVTANWAQWYLTPEGELTREAAGNTPVELRPGRYQLAYTFPDYDNIPADPDEGVEAEPSYLTVIRDFVVLAPVGDVNADLLTTGADARVDETLLESRISPNAGRPALGYLADNYDDGAIFKLRTCDVNNDRNINNIDANTIGKTTAVKQFYLPVNYKPAGTVTPTPDPDPGTETTP